MKPGVELIFDEPMAGRARRYFDALLSGAPDWVTPAKRYTGTRRVAVVYGAGAHWRQEFLRRHTAAGGRYVAFDLAYWDRSRALRLSVDGLHPTAEHLARTAALGTRRTFALRQDASPEGHVLLAGVGRKTAVMYGEAPGSWERSALRRIRTLYPAAPVVWRPKGEAAPLCGLSPANSTPIDVALRGARLAWCRTSNVAVDACLAGVPVSCEGGAAHALYRDDPDPTPEARLRFLNALSWWEWCAEDAGSLWLFIQDVLKER